MRRRKSEITFVLALMLLRAQATTTTAAEENRRQNLENKLHVNYFYETNKAFSLIQLVIVSVR